MNNQVVLARRDYGYSDELYHHGILGQKWGVRRFQNSDGTWTEEGKKRYGDSLEGSKNKTNKGFVRRLFTGDYALIGEKRWADKRENRFQKRIDKAKEKGKSEEKIKDLERKRDAQKQKNIARDKYLANTSTGKIVLQNFLGGNTSGHIYRNLRAADVSRGKAFIGSHLGMLSLLVDWKVSKDKYGASTKTLWYS